MQPENATWGTAVSSLSVANSGTVSAWPTGTATIKGNFTNYGTTTVSRGTLDLAGSAEQGGANSEFALANRSTVKVSGPDRLLGIRNGRITGDGFVDGNLSLGNDPQAAGYNTLPPVSPVIAPGTEGTFGTINVTLSFQIFKGRMEIDVFGLNANQHDRVEVVGYAALADTIVGRFDANHVNFPRGTEITFLTYAARINDFKPEDDITRPWVRDKNATRYRFVRDGKIGGRVGGDGNQNGVFEPGLGETVLAGVGVDLLDADGDFLAHTTTGGDGRYLFEQTGYGYFQVRFERPADTRPSFPHAGSDPAADSDIGVLTCIAGVSVSESDPSSEPDGDALFRPLTANADAVTTAFQTPISSNVLTNDPAADGDILAVTLHSEPGHGTVTLAADGSFTYTPDAGFWGTDTFVYLVTDYYELTATATVTITVTPPPPAIITGRVFYDGYDSNFGSWDGNGIQDTPGGYAVTVQLLDAAGNVVATTTSDASGYYTFSVTLSGSFRVRFSLPEAGGGSMGNGYRFTLQNQGGDDTLDSDADATSGETALFTIDYGQTTALDVGVVLIYSM